MGIGKIGKVLYFLYIISYQVGLTDPVLPSEVKMIWQMAR